jgi:hypothetical protein
MASLTRRRAARIRQRGVGTSFSEANRLRNFGLDRCHLGVAAVEQPRVNEFGFQRVDRIAGAFQLLDLALAAVDLRIA